MITARRERGMSNSDLPEEPAEAPKRGPSDSGFPDFSGPPAGVGQQMWGGRFAAKPDAAMQAINASIDVDKRLWHEDIMGSKAHAAMLAAEGIITREDNDKIQAGLDQIAAEIAQGVFAFSAELEDIHLNIE